MIKYFQQLKNTTNEDGFTLVELMMVIIVIGILAGISVPIFFNQQKEAILATVKNDANNVSNLVTTWKITHNGRIHSSCSQATEFAKDVRLSEGNVLQIGRASCRERV